MLTLLEHALGHVLRLIGFIAHVDEPRHGG